MSIFQSNRIRISRQLFPSEYNDSVHEVVAVVVIIIVFGMLGAGMPLGGSLLIGIAAYGVVLAIVWSIFLIQRAWSSSGL
ncbi:hypothetical protein H7Y40_02060 [Pedobacter sp.]|nr:hypothetical protein [Candidatus Saccharibacteria bacterium]